MTMSLASNKDSISTVTLTLKLSKS